MLCLSKQENADAEHERDSVLTSKCDLTRSVYSSCCAAPTCSKIFQSFEEKVTNQSLTEIPFSHVSVTRPDQVCIHLLGKTKHPTIDLVAVRNCTLNQLHCTMKYNELKCCCLVLYIFLFCFSCFAFLVLHSNTWNELALCLRL